MPNRLAQTQSLYLRKHAENPIDWWPWTEDALATARAQDKPIFLSIGYSSCHWCTVMEGEAFSNGAIADYLNANFLPIKVDREERPDLDSIYMQALQMMIGQGGWPLNIFLTPDALTPFYGGTYFPVEPRYGRPGFLQVLQAIRQFYDREKDKLQDITGEILGNLQNMAAGQPAETFTPALLQAGLQASTSIVAGRNPGPSFPMIPYASVAQRAQRFALEAHDAAAVSQQRGLDLALGGIYDHVAGGFHRYTVDPTWTVPHFEKMLYDNGQIMEYLANLWAAGQQEPAFERAIAGTVQWLQREMTAPDGFFYAAQDADSFVSPEAAEPEEGEFYVWRYDELAALLSPEELTALSEQFTITQSGNFEGQNVLQRQQPGSLSDTVETALDKLFAVRYGAPAAAVTTFPPARHNAEAKTTDWPGRIPCVTDTKMIVAWNSLMISGLARAAAVWQNNDYLALAVGAAQFIRDRQWVDHRLHRVNYDGTPSVLAQSEDYALLIKALLDLHQAHLARQQPAAAADWLALAVRTQQEFDDHLWSREFGGYFNTDPRDDLLVRERSYLDNATPAANGIAPQNLIRLALLTADLTYRDRAEHTLQAFGAIMARLPQSCPSLFAALDDFYHHTLVRTTADCIAQLSPQYAPTTVYQLAEELPTEAIGLVCQGLSCQAPATSWDQLQQQLQQSQTRSL